jgi:hypothetical protein
MREARQGGCARQDRADARGKGGQMREEELGRCGRQTRADVRGKPGQIREARQCR